MMGTVKWFDPIRGYGFITAGPEEIYVHYSSIIDQEPGKKNLIEGELVKFERVETSKGLRAKNVYTIKSV